MAQGGLPKEPCCLFIYDPALANVWSGIVKKGLFQKFQNLE